MEAKPIPTEPQAPPNPLLSQKDLAEYLSCSSSYARKLIDDRTIPSLKLGSLRRVRRSDVDAYVAAQLEAARGTQD